MKRNITIITAFLIAITLYSCGPTVKITKSWQAPNIQDVKDAKILVIARVDDLASRQILESEIATQLKSAGINANPSFQAYPDLNLNKKLEESEVASQVAEFTKDGFGSIVMTVVKSVNSKITTQENGGYTARNYGGLYFSVGYSGFSSYYGNFYSPYGTTGVYVPNSERTYQTKTYNLETVVYDLSKEQKEQLVAVVASSIKSPGSTSTVAKPYAKKVMEQFEK